MPRTTRARRPRWVVSRLSAALRAREEARTYLRGVYPEFLRSSLLLDDMPKLAVGHRRHDAGNAVPPPHRRRPCRTLILASFQPTRFPLLPFFLPLGIALSRCALFLSLSPPPPSSPVFSLSLSLFSTYPLAASLSPSSSFCRLTFRTCISTNPSSCASRMRVTPVSPNANRNSVGRVKNKKTVPQRGISNFKSRFVLWGSAKSIPNIRWNLLANTLGIVFAREETQSDSVSHYRFPNERIGRPMI